MNTARLTRYEVSASLSATGATPMSAASTGSEVEITVASICSMNRAQATIRGMVNVRGKAMRWEYGQGPDGRRCRECASVYHSGAKRAQAVHAGFTIIQQGD